MSQAVRHRLQQMQSKARMGPPAPTDGGIIVISNEPLLLDLTGNDDALPTMVTTSSEPTIPKPKCKQIRPNASSIKQRRVHDVKAKRHKSDAHKAAVCLYNAKKQKPNGLLIQKVQAAITANTKCAQALQQSLATQNRDSSTYPQ
jgi:hypothetical protein